MEKVESLLVKEIEAKMELLRNMDPSDENYNRVLDTVETLVSKHYDFEKLNSDTVLKREQNEAEKVDRNNKMKIDILKVAVPTTAGVLMGLISMKWEKFDTLTSTAGKISLRDIIRFR